MAHSMLWHDEVLIFMKVVAIVNEGTSIFVTCLETKRDVIGKRNALQCIKKG